jgi:predicted dehydrogenase
MRDLIKRGKLGDIVHIEAHYGYQLTGPFGTAILADPRHWVHSLPGKLFHNTIDHLLGKVVDLLDLEDMPGMDVVGLRLRPERFGDARDDMLDELRILLSTPRATAYATFSCHSRPIRHFVNVYGTRGTLQADFVSRTVTFERSQTLPTAVGRLLPPFAYAWGYVRAGVRNLFRFARSEFHYFAGFQALLRAFYGSILEDGPPPIRERHLLLVSALMEEVFRRLNDRRPPP